MKRKQTDIRGEKIAIAVFISFWLFFCGSGVVFAEEIVDVYAAKFDPESRHFTKMETIKTWVASKYRLDNGLMNNIQEQISENVVLNVARATPCIQTLNDPGETRIFGCNVEAIEDLELKFLQFVHEVSMQKSPVTLEIAAGAGNFSWKVPLAFEGGGLHYANDLSFAMMNTEFERIIKRHSNNLQIDLSSFIKKMPGDCLAVLDASELKGKFDAIYVANLEQYFNPVEHQQFLKLLEYLLVPGGQAFLCSKSYEYRKNYPVMKSEQEQLYYPYFIQEVVKMKDGDANHPSILYGSRPIDSTPVGFNLIEYYSEEKVSEKELPQVIQAGKVGLYKNATYAITRNAFSPNVYRAAIANYPTLQVIDTFFVNSLGERYDTMDYGAKRVVAIIKKQQ